MNPELPSVNRAMRYCLYVLFITTLAACSRSVSDLPPSERPIPASLPEAQREASRLLPLEGAKNVRDLGGYPTGEQRMVRWGVFYRSANLADLSTDDQVYMQRLQLQRIVDFRSATEVNDEPDKLGDELQPHYVPMPIAVSEADTKQLMQNIESGSLTADESRQFLVSANRHFVDEYTPLYSEWLHALLDPRNTPMLFHCTEGKDRTGFGAAVLLLTLGVGKPDVMRDYLASNRYLEASVDKRMALMKWASLFQLDTDAIRPVFLVEPQYLESAFQRINERYGSFDNYLRDGLGIDREEQQRLIALYTTAR